MRSIRLAAIAVVVVAFSAVQAAPTQTIHNSPVLLDGTQPSPGATFNAMVTFPADPGATYVLGFDALRLATPIPLAGIGEVGLALSPAFFIFNVGVLDGNGQATVPFGIPANSGLIGFQFYFQAFVQTNQSSAGAYLSNLYCGTIAGSNTRRTTADQLSFGRALHTLTKLQDGSVLIIGGGGGTLTSPVGTTTAERYFPWTDEFDFTRNTAGFPTRTNVQRVIHTSTLLGDGKVLITGGVDSMGTVVRSAELYDPANGTFTAVGTMNVARAGHTATLLPDGKVLVAGGTNAPFALPGLFGGAQRATEYYNPGSRTFSVGPNMNEKRMFHSANPVKQGSNDYVLMSGGIKGLFLFVLPDYATTAEVFDVGSGSFKNQIGSATIAPLNTTRIVAGSATLQNGRVLLAGGVNGVVPAAIGATEEFDPTNGSWTSRPTLSTPRALPAVTVLLDGRVLVEGGTQGSLTAPTSTASAFLYNGSTFTPTVSYGITRGAHAAVLLNSGASLTIGGADTVGNPLRTAEIYTP